MIHLSREFFFDRSFDEFKETDCLCPRDVLYLKKMKKEIDARRMKPRYTEKEAKAGLKEKLPTIETFPNQFSDYEIRIEVPEFTSICPKTGLPDFATIKIQYVPDKCCLELKSLKMYIAAYRNLGIFHEHLVNKILDDLVAACKPRQARVEVNMNSRGGITTRVIAGHKKGSAKHRIVGFKA